MKKPRLQMSGTSKGWDPTPLMLALLVGAVGGLENAHGGESPLEFNRDIRPILSESCLACHGPDSAARQADLRLDQREAAIEKLAITPGDPDASEMIRRILSEDESERMPPPESKKSLTAAQKQLLARWVREGAEYQPHWSLIRPERSALPQVGNGWWIRNSIDNFIAAKLEASSLSPAPEADRRTLARRLSLDLTGLPPAPELVREFVDDPAPDAYERLVDRLLDSPHWGEHRARYWLDAARYGDTHGIHLDNYREMWSYRDWVIRAFNRNIPFDEFTIENLAGDLLPEATIDQKIGSGFNRCNITTDEGGVIPEEYFVLYTRDRVETTSQVWMGLTAGCAVCHDHKFDPLSQREFYELAAFFNNTTQDAMDGNIKDTPPVVMVVRDEDRPRWNELESAIPSLKRRIDDRRAAVRPEFDAWLARAKPEELGLAVPQDALEFWAPLNDNSDTLHYEVRGEKFEKRAPREVQWQPGRLGTNVAQLESGGVLVVAGAGDFDTNQAFSCAAWIKLGDNDPSGAILARMDEDHKLRGWDMRVENRRLAAHLISEWSANAVKVMSRRQLPAGEWLHLAVVYDGTGKAAEVKIFVNGQLQQIEVEADGLTGSIRNGVPLKIGQRNQSAIFPNLGIEDVRVYCRALADVEVQSLKDFSLFAILAAAPDQRNQQQVDRLFDWWLTNFDDESQHLTEEYLALERDLGELKARGTIAHVMQEKPEQPIAFVLNRGEYDKRLDQVTPDTPQMLPPFPADLPRNRLGFAKWLLLAEQPLTARVTVNRFWSEVFGTGLVKTAGDFGVPGELPSHPELLDWLAVEFRESGWDVKRLFKLIVTSATYRQSAIVTPVKLEKDPANRLLSRGPRFRMDAEMVRDYALATSGLLSAKIGGPSVKPYQPPGIWEAVAMTVSNTRYYQHDAGDSLYRRSLYTLWKRAAPPASMDVFNAPTREVCTMVRERTNTPLQALVTLNDPQFVEAARRLAERAIQVHADDDQRLAFIAERLLARRLRPEELEIVRSSLAQLKDHYAAVPDDAAKLIEVGDSPTDPTISPSELAAWTMVVNQLMNLDEVLNK